MPRFNLALHTDARHDAGARRSRYGGSNLRVFGSVAARAETPESDVDLLVDLPERVGLFQVAQLQLDLADLLSRASKLSREARR